MLNNQYHEDLMALRSYAQKLNWFQNLFFPKQLKTKLLQYSPTNAPDPSAAFQIYAIYSKSFGFFNWFHLLGMQFLSGLNEFSQTKTTTKINALHRLTENSFEKLINPLSNNTEESVTESDVVLDTSNFPSPATFESSSSSDDDTSIDASASHNASIHEPLNNQATPIATAAPSPSPLPSPLLPANDHFIAEKIDSIPATPAFLLTPIKPNTPKDNSYNQVLSELLQNTDPDTTQRTSTRTPIPKPEKEIGVSTDSVSMTTPIKRVVYPNHFVEPVCHLSPIPQMPSQKTRHQSCCAHQ